MSIKLAYHCFGSGPPLVILHGLFGCKENWRSLARQFANYFQVFTLDLRNHGQSAHADEFSYQAMADDLMAFLNSQKLDQVHLLGHSMGGKTAMQFAARYPDRLLSLIVEDMAPGAYTPHHCELFAALDGLPLNHLQRRSEADHLLLSDVPDPAVRRFLLKNLQRRGEGGFAWRFNLVVLREAYPDLIAALQIDSPIAVPTLFVRGDRSDYLPPILPPEVTKFFTNVRMETIENAGHWVHAEKPKFFLQAVNTFLEDTSIKKDRP